MNNDTPSTPAEAAPQPAPGPETPPDPPRKIAVVGEIPFSGRALVRVLLRRGFAARALCPDEKSEQAALSAKAADAAAGSADVEIVRGGLGSESSIAEVLRGAHGVVFLSPITMSGRVYRPWEHLDDVKRLVEAAQNGAIRKLVYHSALGAHPESLSRALREAAEAEALVKLSRCEDFMARTGPLMGPGDGFLSEFIAQARARSPFQSVHGYGDTRVQPLHVEDLARCVTRFFVDKPDELRPGHYAVAGPEVTTLLDLMDAVAQRVGRGKLRFHVPLFALRLATAWRKGNGFKERVALLFDLFYAENNDAPRLLAPGEKLITPSEAQEEILKSALNS